MLTKLLRREANNCDCAEFWGFFSKQVMQKEVKLTVKPWEDHNLAIFHLFNHYITHLNNTPISQ